MAKSATSISLCSAGIIVFLGIQISEMNYTGDYSTSRNYISDLGVNSTSAALFNISMMAAGILILVGCRRLRKQQMKWRFIIPLTLYGIGTFGVGLFPSSISLHGVFALLIFLFGFVAAFMSRKYSSKAIRRTSTTLGVLSVVFLVAFIFSDPSFVGGNERLVVYPITIWLIVFGSSSSTSPKRTPSL